MGNGGKNLFIVIDANIGEVINTIEPYSSTIEDSEEDE